MVGVTWWSLKRMTRRSRIVSRFGGFVSVSDLVMPAQNFCVNDLRQTMEKRSKQEHMKPSELLSKSSSNSSSSLLAVKTIEQNPMLGLASVILACVLSGFAGVYFEKILKGGSEVSVWMRNIQLAVLSIPISFVTMHLKDGPALREKGVTYGYDSVVWLVVFVTAWGGLSVAASIKYADNILKNFATSIAIVVACFVSMELFDFQPSISFIFGTSFVIGATFIYSKYPYKPPSLLPLIK